MAFGLTAAFMNFLSSLNPAQQDAVLHTDGPLLILAGAGSGKTRVITSRIAHLIASGLARPGQVLAVTFTNKAAEEMRGRVEQLLGEDCRQIWLSTFHSLSARLLRREAPAIGLDARLRHLRLVRSAVRRQAGDEDAGHRRQARAASRRAGPHQSGQEPDGVARGACARRAGTSAISRSAGFTRSTARPSTMPVRSTSTTCSSRRSSSSKRAKESRVFYASKFKYVLVDEYQDTNRPQYLLIRRFAEVHRNLCVVGDPDQSIYRWRGADLRNILDFERDFPDVHVVKLEQNYRSTQVILDAASAVISRNRNRKDKRLWTDQAGGERDSATSAPADEIEEADFITRTIRESHAVEIARSRRPSCTAPTPSRARLKTR